MSELIVPARMLIENNGMSVCMTRVGVTCLNQQEQMINFVMDPNESPYTVVTQSGSNGPDAHLTIAHVFVDRYLRWMQVPKLLEVWRWHVDVYKAADIVPESYSVTVDTAIRQEMIYRFGFEHVGGMEIVEPSVLNAQFAADRVPTAAATRDLVPERNRYRESHTYLPHPGVFDPRLGILVQFETGLPASEQFKQKWVM